MSVICCLTVKVYSAAALVQAERAVITTSAVPVSPAERAVTRPFSSTVAMLSSEDVKVTVLSVVSSGRTRALRSTLSPIQRLSVSAVSSIASACFTTVTLTVAVILPVSAAVAVMSVSPALIPVTVPFATVATEDSEDSHLRVLSFAFSGRAWTPRVSFLPAPTVYSLSVKTISSTSCLTVKVHSAVLPSSSVVTVTVAVPLPTAVTTPFSSTETTFSSEEVKVTF